MLKKTISTGEVEFDLLKNWSENVLNLFVIFVAVVALLTTIIYGHFNERRYTNTFAVILGSIYLYGEVLNLNSQEEC